MRISSCRLPSIAISLQTAPETILVRVRPTAEDEVTSGPHVDRHCRSELGTVASTRTAVCTGRSSRLSSVSGRCI